MTASATIVVVWLLFVLLIEAGDGRRRRHLFFFVPRLLRLSLGDIVMADDGVIKYQNESFFLLVDIPGEEEMQMNIKFYH